MTILTKDEIIRMAKEAGCLGPSEGGDPNGLWEPNGWENVTELMFRFADLIAAAEREECADIADQHASIEGIAQSIAAAIRERGEK